MMCALEMAIAINEEERIKAEEKRKKEALNELLRMEALKSFFEEDLEKFVEYVENALLKNRGTVRLRFEKCGNNGFAYFCEKKFLNNIKRYYYSEARLFTWAFPIEECCAYLENHCYKITISKAPSYKGYSYSGKTSMMVDSVYELEISI